jgi:BirA family biotin operon repressor/biotin-[acetyl-CoA-carboxylase] ligase
LDKDLRVSKQILITSLFWGCLKAQSNRMHYDYVNTRKLLPIQTVEHYDEIPSTNDRIQELLRQSIKPKLPCLVTAKRQTAGRGRGNKRWWSGEGAILMSLGFELSPELLTRDQLPTFSATVAQRIINVLSRYLQNHKLEVHLPNDVYADGKKICGILIESPTPQYGILGIGLNVNNRLCDIPAEFLENVVKQPITSMIELLNQETNISRLMDELLNELGFTECRSGNHSKRQKNLFRSWMAV